MIKTPGTYRAFLFLCAEFLLLLGVGIEKRKIDKYQIIKKIR